MNLLVYFALKIIFEVNCGMRPGEELKVGGYLFI